MKEALVAISRRAGGLPTAVISDQGAEFQGEVARYLKHRKVAQRTKDPADKNGLAVVDRAMQALKVRLAERMAREPGAWDTHLKKITTELNATAKPGVLHGAAPDDVEKDEQLQFMLGLDNSKKLQHNIDQQKKRAEATKGRPFRTPVKNNFNRAYNPNWSSTTQHAADVQGSKVIAADGSTYPLKSIRVVPWGAEGEVKARFGQSRLHQVKTVVDNLQALLRERGPLSMKDALEFLNHRLPTTDQRLKTARMTFAQMVEESPLFKKDKRKLALA